MLAKVQNILLKHKLLVSLAIFVLVIVLVAVFLVGRSNKPVQAASTPTFVEVVAAKQEAVPIYSEWIGTADGMVNAEIRAQVSGYLLKQDYKEGSLVKKGQLLFEIDSRPFQAALGQANGDLAKAQGQLGQMESQLAQAEANLAQANSQLIQAQAQLSQSQAGQRKTQLDVDKYTPLAAQKAVTQQDLDNAEQANVAAKAQIDASRAGIETAKAGVKAANAGVGTAKSGIAAAKAQVESSQAAVRTAELNVSFTRIVSPIDGIAGIAQAQVGNLVNPTSGVLTTVSTVDPIKVGFTLSESDYLKFNKSNLINARQGSSIEQLELELVLSDGTVYPEKGRFYLADRQVDQKTGSIRLAGVFPNASYILRPGLYGKVRAITSTRENAIVIPQRAVNELQGGYQVAVVDVNNKVEFRSVKVSDRFGTDWIIGEGLKPGERVIVEGLQKVRSGAVVDPRPYVNTGAAKN
ncbi:MAG TPA: efflux RND transporter periplasmic adaptor subunit [Pyrinomonadaceae bacterium]|nr:efflux RND transporter periplasmic adaptor subunit [Pyrinomonadaceae bacterium]